MNHSELLEGFMLYFQGKWRRAGAAHPESL